MNDLLQIFDVWVQGLELDWACLAWDADLRMGAAEWSHHDFSGSKWKNIHSAENRRNLQNAYRVLLTRARQGMAIIGPAPLQDRNVAGNRSDGHEWFLFLVLKEKNALFGAT